MKNLAKIEFDKNVNPFEAALNATQLLENFNNLDNNSLNAKFKSSQDPINYAFDAINEISLKDLAIDFVKETFQDTIEFITGICK